jgi:hypothetical protein
MYQKPNLILMGLDKSPKMIVPGCRTHICTEWGWVSKIIDNHPLRTINQPKIKHRRQKIPPLPPQDQTQAHDALAAVLENDLSQHALDGDEDPFYGALLEDESSGQLTFFWILAFKTRQSLLLFDFGICFVVSRASLETTIPNRVVLVSLRWSVK